MTAVDSVTKPLVMRKRGNSIRPSPLFFFRLASNAFPDIGSVGRIEKKNLKEKSQEVSE